MVSALDKPLACDSGQNYSLLLQINGVQRAITTGILLIIYNLSTKPHFKRCELCLKGHSKPSFSW